MSTVILTARRHSLRVAARLGDYAELGKLRIALLELVVVAVAATLAGGMTPSAAMLVPLLLGTTLVAVSASIANQWLERHHDARMPRTAHRPLPAGRISPAEAVILSAVTLPAGALLLGLQVNWTCAAVAILTWVVYVCVYTPLKTRSPLNTAVGAVSGCLPVLIGWTASSPVITLTALSLTMVVFLWQFPHFMAIAWLYRRDYAAGGFRMLTVVDGSGLRAAAQAMAAALALIPVSLVPAWTGQIGSELFYALWATALGIAYAIATAGFLATRNSATARRLLRASLLYLPLILVLFLVVSG